MSYAKDLNTNPMKRTTALLLPSDTDTSNIWQKPYSKSKTR
jgi:hypothetical protein